jgi:hypothetical protein
MEIQLMNKQEVSAQAVVDVEMTAVNALSADLAAVVAPQNELNQAFEDDKKLDEELELSQAKGEAVQVASADNGAAAMLLTDTNQAATGAALGGGAAASTAISTNAFLIAGAAAVAAVAVVATDDDDNNSSATTSNTPDTPDTPDTAPVVSADQNLSVAQGKSAVITVVATDADGDQLDFTPSNPANGTLGTTSQPGQYTYTSDANFVGTDTFTVTVSDEDSNTVTRTITVEVTKAALVNTELTTGQDTVQGTAADETINAKYGGAATPTTTFTPFDTIDGGAGTDTFNIYTSGAVNGVFPANASVQNVEIVNVYNTAAAGVFGDASKFVGVTQLNQLGASVDAVTNLLATTTAGFSGTQQDGLNVTAQAAATSAAVALTNANDGSPTGLNSGITLNVSGTKLNAVTVAGTLAPSLGGTAAANPAALTLAITGDAAATALTVNTAVKSTLTVAGMTASTSVDASASTGDLTYTSAPAGIATIKTGSGADVVQLNTSDSATISANLETGAGKDAITVNTTGVGKTTVSSGDGDDTIAATAGSATGGLAISAGAGNDVIKGTGAALADKTTVDGGAGIDTLELANTALSTNDIALLTSRVTNVEQLKFTAVVAPGLDASALGTQFSQLEFSNTGGTSTVTKVSAAQKIVGSNLDATANGYVATVTTTTPNTPPKGGVLNITSSGGLAGGTSTVVAKSEVVNLTVATTANTVATTVANNTTTLDGDFATVNVNLVSTENVVAGSTTTDNVASITYTSSGLTAASAVETMVITGEGSAVITNFVVANPNDGNTLTSVDASGLGNTLVNGDISAGLKYTAGTIQETIKLSAANDEIITNSVYGVNGNLIDTISGFDAVNEAAGAKGSTDVIKFGATVVGGPIQNTLDGDAANEAIRLDVTSESSLAGAFLKAAGVNNALSVTVFTFGTDTYLFQNKTVNTTLDADDFALKVSGLVAFETQFNPS